jgi:hypothetical protein
MRRLLAHLTALAACLVMHAAAAGAQDGASIAGRVVHKASKAGIPGAEVLLAPRTQRVISDFAGHFRFDGVPAGIVALLVRRIGFAPESASFEVAAREDVDILVEMEEMPQTLDTVNVAARAAPIARGKLAAFDERKRFGIGRFIDSTVLLDQQNRQLGELIVSRSPGSRLVRSRLGAAAWVATSRRSGQTLTPRSTVDDSDRNRGADPRACYPDVYLDGAVVYSFGKQMPLFDINSVPTSNVAAIEFYVGPAQVPLQFNKTGAACGVLVIWTK